MNKELSVSESAKNHFEAIIKKKNCHGIVFKVKQAGCSGLKYDMCFVENVPVDAMRLSYNNVNLYVDNASKSYLSETAIDLETVSLGQTKIVFFNPKAQNACGCGESFNLKGDESG